MLVSPDENEELYYYIFKDEKRERKRHNESAETGSRSSREPIISRGDSGE